MRRDPIKKRQMRVRKYLMGTAEKPRFCVVKSNCHIYAQLIDDEAGKTLVGARCERKMEAAKELGKSIGEKAKGASIERVVFDRGASKYHGVMAAVADGAREAGLQF